MTKIHVSWKTAFIFRLGPDIVYPALLQVTDVIHVIPTVVPIQFDGLFEYKRIIESNWD